MNCKECGTPVKGSGTKYCSTDCQTTYKSKVKHVFFLEKQKEVEGQENIDYVTCKWCNCKVKRIYGSHIKNHHPGKTLEDYRLEFPFFPIASQKDKVSTSKNSGQHMKSEKYKNWASQRIRGEANPNHSSKTSEEVRKARSPFSKDFAKYSGSVDKEACVKEFAKAALKDRLTETQLPYWVKKFDGDVELAKAAFSERQSTFTSAKCIARYGEKEGMRRWQNRNTKWSIKVEEKYHNGEFTRFCKSNYSKKELIFFQNLTERYSTSSKVYSALDNGTQFFYRFKDHKVTHSYDFVVDNKIIEFNGDYWHCNPKKYPPNYWHQYMQCNAQDKWDADAKKIKLAEQIGYKVLVVWESDYTQDPAGTLQKCINFLND